MSDRLSNSLSRCLQALGRDASPRRPQVPADAMPGGRLGEASLPGGTASTGRRSGMSLIELVAALALFAIILGSLLMILNAATSLWSNSRNQNKEQNNAQDVLELISDDLRHAVVDNDPDKNARPSFVMESPPSNPAPNEVYIMLRFARYAGAVTAGSKTTSAPSLSVEAVFYTYYNSTLFRHVVNLPFTYDGVSENESLGKRLYECGNQLNSNRGLHDYIYARAKGKSNPSDAVEPTQPPDCHWTCSLLAENASIDLRAALPSKLSLPASQESSPPVVVDKISDVREYKHLETRVLPDRIDVAVGIQTEESLGQPPQAAGGIDYQYSSQRITFPAQGGSRLP